MMKRILALLFLMGCSSAYFLQVATPNATIYLYPEVNRTTAYSVMLYCYGNSSDTIDISIGSITQYVAISPGRLVLEKGKCYNVTLTASLPPDETLVGKEIIGEINANSENSVCSATQCYNAAELKYLVIYPQEYVPPKMTVNISDDTNATDSPSSNIVYAKDYTGYAPYAILALALVAGACYLSFFRNKKEVKKHGKHK